ncbi:NAD(P)H-dependent oxidoreductase [Vibrio alfacsensis]|uniref:NAD(P)H-dependent oxidoreductase n=1 Tax=Vibrio alfacsensis TaxID=1074311 RepID=UPI00406934A0
MCNVCVISGHPALANSHANALILDELSRELATINVRRLDELYPDYAIDVQAEQEALLKADVIVLQFPFYWYSTPALMKKWIDDVFTFNFAYGPEGDKLKGKDFILSFTVGGPDSSYDPLGYNHFTIEQMIRPLQQTAYLAEMNYIKPIYSHGMVYIPNVYNTLEAVQGRAKSHAKRLIEQIKTQCTSPDIKIKNFTTKWFAKLDELPAESDYFTQFLHDGTVIEMPEGTFVGKEGFNAWYRGATSTFKPNCEHIVEQLEIRPDGDQYLVRLRVRLKADTDEASQFQGKSINMLVNETWLISISSHGSISIDKYLVEMV